MATDVCAEVHRMSNRLCGVAHRPEDVGDDGAGGIKIARHALLESFELVRQVRACLIHLVANHRGGFVHDVDS